MAKSKSVLFIAPTFYGYEQIMLAEIQEQGFAVDAVFYEFNAIIGDSEESKAKLLDYHNQLNACISNTAYDYLFAIKGNILSLPFLADFIDKNPRSNRIMYQWDSIRNSKLSPELFSMFNKVYSFDLKDIEDFPAYKLIHKPLFYIDSYENVPLSEEKYDITTVGRMDVLRLNLVQSIRQQFPKFRYKILLKTTFGPRFLLNLLIRGYRKYSQNATFTTISSEDVAILMSHSKAILDIAHLEQSGLTIRTFETLALKKKLITTNGLVSKYDFYHPNNIFVLTKDSLKNLAEFMDAPFVQIDAPLYKKYALRSWIASFFADNYVEYLLK